ncbi:MAG: spondin domain-containing protein [Cyanobacteria bacterium J06607_6]
MQTQLTISVENLAPQNGTSLTPFWFGLHNGSFDTYDRGRPASLGLEQVAEDGNNAGITQEFEQAGFGTVQGTIGAAPIAPGETVEFVVTVDAHDPSSRYFNYASMILPSNDFFVANGNELAHEVFDEDGDFLGADFIVPGAAVLDAGTEINDELPETTAFFGQSAPNTGTPENGVIQLAEGFIPGGRILSEPRFAEGDFTAPDYEVARIRIFNTLNGEAGDDDITGANRDDLINGNEGDDRLRGRRGNDRLLGGLGDDHLQGNGGDDDLLGGEGNDRLRGGNGDDTLYGGAGFDRVSGGRGSDIFVLSAGIGVDTITDFQLGSGDQLSLLGGLTFGDLTLTAVGRNGRHTAISVGVDELAVLNNVSADTITEAAFV